jgi:hypothetical protein
LVCALACAAPAFVARASSLGEAMDTSPWTCATTVIAAPWNTTTHTMATGDSGTSYVVALWATATSRFSGRVLLVTDSDVYSFPVKNATLRSTPDPHLRMVPPLLVRFNSSVVIRNVAAVVTDLDGKPNPDCYTYVSDQTSSWEAFQHTRLTRFAISGDAVHERSLDGCAPYQEAKIATTENPQVDDYGSVKRFALLYVYLGADGHPIKSRVFQSSGIDGIDRAALHSADASTYTGAQIACQPLSSIYTFKYEYDP